MAICDMTLKASYERALVSEQWRALGGSVKGMRPRAVLCIQCRFCTANFGLDAWGAREHVVCKGGVCCAVVTTRGKCRSSMTYCREGP